MIDKSKAVFQFLVAIEQENLKRPTEPSPMKNSKFSLRGLGGLGIESFCSSNMDAGALNTRAFRSQRAFRIH